MSDMGELSIINYPFSERGKISDSMDVGDVGYGVNYQLSIILVYRKVKSQILWMWVVWED